MINKSLFTIKLIKNNNKKKLTIAILNANNKMFVIFIVN